MGRLAHLLVYRRHLCVSQLKYYEHCDGCLNFEISPTAAVADAAESAGLTSVAHHDREAQQTLTTVPRPAAEHYNSVPRLAAEHYNSVLTVRR